MSDADPGLKIVTAVIASVVVTVLVTVLLLRPPALKSPTTTTEAAEALPATSTYSRGELSIIRSADTLQLVGRVPDPTTRARLILASSLVYPALTLQSDTLTVDPTAAPLHWQDGLLGPLARLRTLPTYELTIAETLRISTTLSSDQGRAAWVDYLSRFATGEPLMVDSSGITIDPLAMMLPEDPDLLFAWRPDYARGSAALPPQARQELAAMAELLALEPGLVRIIGHASELDQPGANKSLSGERAEAVRTALRRAGLPSEKLISMGRGQDVPLADSAVPEAAAVNRRIEFAR
ncbi:OmpA family protein [Novosphingobium sp.]|uniref:OmpA family protein n=1 Tax=Novosphingobium sp. TaxID=1874826 RepID=UPI002632AA58|nr:OmpA family protein [Novosphingobium sp.]